MGQNTSEIGSFRALEPDGFRHGQLDAFDEKSKVPLSKLFVSMLNAVDAPLHAPLVEKALEVLKR